MRTRLISAALALLIGASPALATQGSVNLASPTGSVQTTSDATATNLISMGAICGAALATLYASCAFQAQVNSSGQLSVTGPVTNAGTFAVQAAQSGTWNITNVSGTVSLPTGAATQTTLAAILTALGSPLQAGGNINIASCASGVCGLPTITTNALVFGAITSPMTGTTATSLISAVTSQHIYVTSIACQNTSATATLVQVLDGASTVIGNLAAVATYGGDNRQGAQPLFVTTAGNALEAKNVTTGASVTCNASGYSSAN